MHNKDYSVIEKLMGIKIPLGMVISELTFYSGMLDLTLKNGKTPDVPDHLKEEVMQNIEAAIEVLQSIREKFRECFGEGVKKNE